MDTQHSLIPLPGLGLQAMPKAPTNTIANADQNPFLNQCKDDANDIQTTLVDREAWNRPSPQALQEFEAKFEDLQCSDVNKKKAAKDWIRNLDESYKVKIIQLVRLGLEYMPLVYSDRPTFTQEGEYNKMVKPLEIMEAFIPLLHPDLLESVVKELLSMQQSSAYSLQQREAMLSLALLVMEGEEFTHTHNNIKKELDSLLAVLLGLIDFNDIGPKSPHNWNISNIYNKRVGAVLNCTIKTILDPNTLNKLAPEKVETVRANFKKLESIAFQRLIDHFKDEKNLKGAYFGMVYKPKLNDQMKEWLKDNALRLIQQEDKEEERIGAVRLLLILLGPDDCREHFMQAIEHDLSNENEDLKRLKYGHPLTNLWVDGIASVARIFFEDKHTVGKMYSQEAFAHGSVDLLIRCFSVEKDHCIKQCVITTFQEIGDRLKAKDHVFAADFLKQIEGIDKGGDIYSRRLRDLLQQLAPEVIASRVNTTEMPKVEAEKAKDLLKRLSDSNDAISSFVNFDGLEMALDLDNKSYKEQAELLVGLYQYFRMDSSDMENAVCLHLKELFFSKKSCHIVRNLGLITAKIALILFSSDVTDEEKKSFLRTEVLDVMAKKFKNIDILMLLADRLPGLARLISKEFLFSRISGDSREVYMFFSHMVINLGKPFLRRFDGWFANHRDYQLAKEEYQRKLLAMIFSLNESALDTYGCGYGYVSGDATSFYDHYKMCVKKFLATDLGETLTAGFPEGFSKEYENALEDGSLGYEVAINKGFKRDDCVWTAKKIQERIAQGSVCYMKVSINAGGSHSVGLVVSGKYIVKNNSGGVSRPEEMSRFKAGFKEHPRTQISSPNTVKEDVYCLSDEHMAMTEFLNEDKLMSLLAGDGDLSTAVWDSIWAGEDFQAVGQQWKKNQTIGNCSVKGMEESVTCTIPKLILNQLDPKKYPLNNQEDLDKLTEATREFSRQLMLYIRDQARAEYMANPIVKEVAEGKRQDFNIERAIDLSGRLLDYHRNNRLTSEQKELAIEGKLYV